ncbi:MAG: hypothetical protein JSV88_25675 [Candidatus Aminicenantes bacterium]|nr:MAG: hypothetical protein JSV88_25675 [Candidatus Aminicenantes bacterium]
MKLFKQIYTAFEEKSIDPADPLEDHFDIIHDILWKYCLTYGKRASFLDREDLKDVYRETSEYLLQRFQAQDIDIKEILIEDSEPVIEKFVSAFIFIFQRRMVNRIKKQNQWFRLVEEFLEDLEKQGIEEPDLEEIGNLQGRIGSILPGEHFSKTEKLFMEFILSKLNTGVIKNKEFIDYYAKKGEGTITESRVSRIKTQLKNKLRENRKLLEEILLFF